MSGKAKLRRGAGRFLNCPATSRRVSWTFQRHKSNQDIRVEASTHPAKRTSPSEKAGFFISSINHIGRAVESAVVAQGYSVCTDLTGHGIGRRIDEQPNVPNSDSPGFDQPLTEGLVITIEPIIAAGTGAVVEASDEWTIKTQDGSYVAHSEHTIVATPHLADSL
jgi:Xaa-Pro aminopeptidase